MGRLAEGYERLLWAIGRQPGRVVSVLAVATYAGVGLAIPLAFDWTVSWLVAANVIGTGFAGLFALTWIANGVQATYRRQLVEWTTDLRNLSAEEFEWLVGEVFRREGWKAEETGSQSGPDGNIDLRLTKGRARALVQCKRWTSWLVGVDDIRAFAGTLMREGLPGTAGVFVTLSDFTDAARADGKELGIALVDGRDLHARVEKVRTPEPCPICGAPMRLGHSQRGWWFRCVTSGCAGKRDLGNRPGVAVQLLNEAPDR